MGHVCVPGTTVDAVFASRPAYMREVYDQLLARLRLSGPVHEDAVTVGVFLKAERKIAEVRPMVRAVKVFVMLPRPVEGARQSSASSWYLARSFTSAEVPEEFLELLDEAYDAAL
jgi:hypothetical protein